ncbi:MAG: response regulator, partial [Alphaproteobacteria bacterium]
GHIHVTTKTERRGGILFLRIDVEDTGIGIAEHHINLVFEQFKQADSSVSRKFGGTGLGLSISKRLADLMGGDIEVKSKLGKGSTFSLILPLPEETEAERRQEMDAHLRAKLTDRQKSAIRDTQKILLVEDYDGNVAVLGYFLEDLGINYDVAQTGLEAVNLWNDNHYSLILMDIQMPEMDGFTSTRLIRSIEEEKSLSRTPIVGMTAHALIGDKDKCLDAGMDAYLPKPIVEQDLKSVILKFLVQEQPAL